jgi:hypothetical protein
MPDYRDALSVFEGLVRLLYQFMSFVCKHLSLAKSSVLAMRSESSESSYAIQ